MIKQLKTLTVNIFAGANVATVLLMLAAGYSDRVSPVSYPLFSNLGMVFPVFLLVNLVFIFFWLTFKWRKGLSAGFPSDIPLYAYALGAGGSRRSHQGVVV